MANAGVRKLFCWFMMALQKDSLALQGSCYRHRIVYDCVARYFQSQWTSGFLSTGWKLSMADTTVMHQGHGLVTVHSSLQVPWQSTSIMCNNPFLSGDDGHFMLRTVPKWRSYIDNYEQTWIIIWSIHPFFLARPLHQSLVYLEISSLHSKKVNDSLAGCQKDDAMGRRLRQEVKAAPVKMMLSI